MTPEPNEGGAENPPTSTPPTTTPPAAGSPPANPPSTPPAAPPATEEKPATEANSVPAVSEEKPAPQPRWEGRQLKRDVMLTPCDPENIPAECRIPDGVTPCDECWIARDPRNVNDMWLMTSMEYMKYIVR